jgi:transcriptional regulator with XRE-family HTH domain
MSIDRLVGDRIRLIREKLLFTLSDIARLTEIDIATLQSIENGHLRPAPWQLLRIAEELEISVSNFFED